MRSVLLAMFCIAFSASIAQVRDSSLLLQQDSALSIFEYFIKNEIAEVTLKTNMKGLQKNKFNEVYQTAEFSFSTEDSTQVRFAIEVRTRGNVRKKNCQFPSLKLNFLKSDLKSKGFGSVDKYKLVCQCASGKSAGQLLLKEYLAYQLYNIIAENSFKTHLFTINYVDTKKDKTKTRYGFLIESEKELVHRVNATEVNTDSMRFYKINRENIIQMGMFEYMIGNTDFSLKNMHNIKAIKPNDSEEVYLIAYDFDYSGLVNASYAVPNSSLPIKDVKDRWFKIRGCSQKEIEHQAEYFLTRKKEIMNYCQNFTIFIKYSYDSRLDFISDFFKIIENPNTIKSEFIH